MTRFVALVTPSEGEAPQAVAVDAHTREEGMALFPPEQIVHALFDDSQLLAMEEALDQIPPGAQLHRYAVVMMMEDGQAIVRGVRAENVDLASSIAEQATVEATGIVPDRNLGGFDEEAMTRLRHAFNVI